MGTPVGRDAISTWLDEAGIRLRQIRKDIPGGEHPDRNAQFEIIAELIEQYESEGNPWFSIDTKAKEHLGKLYRKGRIRGSEPFKAFDHDFPSWADGVIIPHGIFDRKLNLGQINIGLSRDTTEFACDSFRWYWNRIGKQRYRDATSILLTCDGGGSNSARKYIFKHDLERLSDSIGLPIRVAHYPPYCSKYNPIERRFFPHLGRACSGMLFDTLEAVVSDLPCIFPPHSLRPLSASMVTIGGGSSFGVGGASWSFCLPLASSDLSPAPLPRAFFLSFSSQ